MLLLKKTNYFFSLQYEKFIFASSLSMCYTEFTETREKNIY